MQAGYKYRRRLPYSLRHLAALHINGFLQPKRYAPASERKRHCLPDPVLLRVRLSPRKGSIYKDRCGPCGCKDKENIAVYNRRLSSSRNIFGRKLLYAGIGIHRRNIHRNKLRQNTAYHCKYRKHILGNMV